MFLGAPVGQWAMLWHTDQADWVQAPLEMKTFSTKNEVPAFQSP